MGGSCDSSRAASLSKLICVSRGDMREVCPQSREGGRARSRKAHLVEKRVRLDLRGTFGAWPGAEPRERVAVEQSREHIARLGRECRR